MTKYCSWSNEEVIISSLGYNPRNFLEKEALTEVQDLAREVWVARQSISHRSDTYDHWLDGLNNMFFPHINEVSRLGYGLALLCH